MASRKFQETETHSRVPVYCPNKNVIPPPLFFAWESANCSWAVARRSHRLITVKAVARPRPYLCHLYLHGCTLPLQCTGWQSKDHVFPSILLYLPLVRVCVRVCACVHRLRLAARVRQVLRALFWDGDTFQSVFLESHCPLILIPSLCVELGQSCSVREGSFWRTTDEWTGELSVDGGSKVGLLVLWFDVRWTVKFVGDLVRRFIERLESIVITSLFRVMWYWSNYTLSNCAGFFVVVLFLFK